MRREKTLADYVVIAISPALIMTLVGSLAFFLLEVSYRGEHETRLLWVLFWFVFAAVLVARIAIEEGIEHARIFGVVMIAAAGFFAYRFVDAVVVAWVLLAVIWWCSSKLTWDCTLVDESEDASGEGLLQAAGLGEGGGVTPSKAPAAADGDGLASASKDESPGAGRRPHAPGLWVVYFSLAALPLFGVGQLLIPATRTGGRAYGFRLLAVYVASALGLLLTTSFLGLRRYLRQRKLRMPVAMTGTWIGMGTALVIALLLLALLLSRPQGEYTLTALVDKIDAQVREASRLAVLREGRGQGEGRPLGEQDKKADKPGDGQPRDPKQSDAKQPDQKEDKQQDRQGQGEASGGGKKDQDGKGDKGQAKADSKGDPKPGGKGDGKPAQNQDKAAEKPKPDDQKPPAGKPPQEAKAEANHPPPPGSSSSSLTSLVAQLAPFVKWLLYGLLAAVAIYLLFRHWSRLLEILAQLWAELLSLFGFKPNSAAGDAAEPSESLPAPQRPFASFEDPFFSGAARRMAPAQLVLYTFEALEAWAREQAVARPPDQTPLEFAQDLGRRVPAMAKDVSQTAQLYARVAYAKKSPAKDSLDILERMWRRMQVTVGK